MAGKARPAARGGCAAEPRLDPLAAAAATSHRAPLCRCARPLMHPAGGVISGSQAARFCSFPSASSSLLS
eukprot:442893-Pleurochrysis_carterae.AAC.1